MEQITVDGAATAAAADVTVWGANSIRALRVHWMLLELGVPYAFAPVRPRIETEEAGFRAINPRGKVPVLRHGKLTLTESAAIVHYLAEAFDKDGEKIETARDTASRARHAEWSYFIMTELDAHTLYVIRRHSQLKHLFGEAPTAVQAARTYFDRQITAMAGRIASGSDYIFGPRPSPSDILLGTCLEWADSVDLELPPPMRAYYERCRARAAYQAAHARTFAQV